MGYLPRMGMRDISTSTSPMAIAGTSTSAAETPLVSVLAWQLAVCVKFCLAICTKYVGCYCVFFHDHCALGYSYLPVEFRNAPRSLTTSEILFHGIKIMHLLIN